MLNDLQFTQKYLINNFINNFKLYTTIIQLLCLFVKRLFKRFICNAIENIKKFFVISRILFRYIFETSLCLFIIFQRNLGLSRTLTTSEIVLFANDFQP